MLKMLGKTIPHFSIGLICYVIISFLCEKNFSIKILFFSIFASVAPDLDFIPYLILRKKHGITTHQHFHFLAVWILAVIVIYLFLGTYCAFLFLFPVMIHLFYDATDIQGLWFFLPFSKRHFRLELSGIDSLGLIDFRFVDSENDFQDIHSNLRKGLYERNIIDEINIRFELTKNEIIFFIFSILPVLLYAYFC